MSKHKIDDAEFTRWQRDMDARFREAGYTEDDIRLIRRLASAETSRPTGKRGRNVKWTAELNRQLVREVLESAGGFNARKVSAACRLLAEREPWRSLAENSVRDAAKVLRERFQRNFIGCVDIYQSADGSRLVTRVRRKAPKRGGKHQ
jgi:hypothetical protein